MLTRRDREKFERITMPHLDSAYNLALWIMQDPAEAEDVVQSSFMKAFENFLAFRGENYTAWLLTIVRNTAFNLLKKKRSGNIISFDETLHSQEKVMPSTSTLYYSQPDDMICLTHIDSEIKNAVYSLSAEHREVLFLRELEGYSYKEISAIVQVEVGTVMSRLSRARDKLRKYFAVETAKEHDSEL